jgi:hypothetical protein
MKQFIKAKAENGEEVYINLSHVSFIRKTDSGYILSVLGNKFTIDTADGKDTVHSLIFTKQS